MPATYEPIQTTKLTSAQNRINFSNISQSYTDLVLVVNVFSTAVNDVRIELNSDSGSNYNCARITASGATPSAGTALNNGYFWSAGVVGVGSIGGHIELHIMRYSSSQVQKAAFGKTFFPNADGNGEVNMHGFNWNSTSAVNAIGIYSAGNNSPQTLAAGTTATLYGILRA